MASLLAGISWVERTDSRLAFRMAFDIKFATVTDSREATRWLQRPKSGRHGTDTKRTNRALQSADTFWSVPFLH